MPARGTKRAPRGAPKRPKASARGSTRGGRGGSAASEHSVKPVAQPAPKPAVPQQPKVSAWKEVSKNVNTIRTFKAQESLNYYQQKRDGKNRFLGPPPEDLISKARMVVPGDHKVPSDLNKPGALDHIRKSCQVWIVHVKPNVLDIHARDVSDLRSAVTEINWAIHNFRLSNEHPDMRFFIQSPTEVDEDIARIIVTLNGRPHVDPELASEEASNHPSVGDMIPKLWFDMNPEVVERSLETLRGLDKDLRMRVNFGHFKVLEKKKSSGNSFTYETLPIFLKAYPARGTRGARLEKDMPDAANAQNVLGHLGSYFMQESDFVTRYSAVITTATEDGSRGYEITSDIVLMDDGLANPRLENPTITIPEEFSRMNWVFIAPDKPVDWSIQADAWEDVEGGPAIVDKVKLYASQTDYEGAFWFPRLGLEKLDFSEFDVRPKEIRLKSAFVIPHKNPNWHIEVGVSKTWNGNDLSREPEITWSVEIYGNQWAGTINTLTGASKRKAWGHDFSDMWPGSGGDFSGRFQEFLGVVADVQGIIADAIAPDSEA